MAQAHATRSEGKRHIETMLAASALAKGDIIQTIEATGSKSVNNAAAGSAVFGMTTQAIANGESGLVDKLRPGDRVWVKVTSGTVNDALMGKFGDIVDEASVTTSNSNNDVRFVSWDGVTTDFAVVEFTTPETATPTVLA